MLVIGFPTQNGHPRAAVALGAEPLSSGRLSRNDQAGVVCFLCVCLDGLALSGPCTVVSQNFESSL